MPGPAGETVGELLTAAVRAVFSRWTALHLAVTHGGAHGAAAVADALLADATALALAGGPRAPAVEDYGVLFGDAFGRLGTDVEDGSCEEVGTALVRLREAAVSGRADVLRAEAEKGVRGGAGVGGSMFQGESSGSDESGSDGEGEEGDGMEVERSARLEPEVDDDGFTVVRRQTRSMTAARR